MIVARWLRSQLSGPIDMSKMRLSAAAVMLGLFIAFCWVSFDSAWRVAALEVSVAGYKIWRRAAESAAERAVTAQEGLGSELKAAGEQMERKLGELRDASGKAGALLAEVKEAGAKTAAQVTALAAEVAAQGAKLAKLVADYAAHTALNLELASSVEAAHKSLNETTK